MSTEVISGYLAGKWTIDTVHSDVSFFVPQQSTVSAVIKTGSVNTNNEGRDTHVRSADFLDTEQFPDLTFTSTAIRPESAAVFQVDGELTLRGVTKSVTLELELNGFGTGFDGNPVAGFSAATEISRSEFGVTGGPAGAAVGDKITIALEIEAVQA
jgi:polyisoprenoid-binding protein YceI